MAIKMRVSREKDTCICMSCKKDFKVSLEMYDVMVGKELVFTLCDKCLDEMLKKCCSASCKYNAKLKSQQDIAKIEAVQRYRDSNEGNRYGR